MIRKYFPRIARRWGEMHLSAKNALLSPIEISHIYVDMICLSCTLRPFHAIQDTMRDLPKYLTQDDLRRFFAAIDSPRDHALFAVIYHYSLRVDEAAARSSAKVTL
jgi:integrase